MSGLRLDAISKRFGGLTAVDTVTLDIPAGRVTGLIGPNGAGKTTVVNLITGMLSVSSGRITFGAIDLTDAPAHRIGQAGISRTFQNIRLQNEATVLANVMIGFHRREHSSLFASLFGLRSALRETAQIRAQAMDLIGRFGMARFIDHPAGSLAYGHQRRVEMMRALAADPSILLLDEPVAGMNDIEASELGEIFSGLAKGGIGILLIEHNVRFVTRLCNHVYVLDGGKMIAWGTPLEVVADPAVIAAYLGG